MPLDGKKSLRQFYCPDVLWQTFLRMAEEQEKGVDELISDAMVAYAQLSGYQTGISDESTPPPSVPAPRLQAPPPPSMPARTARTVPAPTGGLGAHTYPTPPPPPRLPPTDLGSSGQPLYLVFDNQKYRIDKDQFIIGRGAKSSDLPIKDGNISRKHAAVIRRNGTYFIKDLGSTNGIDFKGMRIDNKRIDEGDIFHLCDYELKFTYKR
jgi:hypothetical protein